MKKEVMTDHTDEELKPCPFCGREPYFERTGTNRHSCIVTCGNCGCTHESGDEGSRSGFSWNTRTPSQQDLARMARMREALAAIANPSKHLNIWVKFQPRMPDAEVHVKIAEQALSETSDIQYMATVPDAERFFPFEFEVWQHDEMVASASGPRDDALREAMNYAAQYEQDGPIRIFEVNRRLIDAPSARSTKGEDAPI